MELIITILLAIIAGFLLAGSRLDKWMGKRGADVQGWYRDRFQQDRIVDMFRAWVAGPDGSIVEDEFKSWLAGLSDDALGVFTRALSAYLKDLGYDLTSLLQGDLDDQESLKEPMISAVTAYSRSYREAARIRQEAAQANG